MAEDVCFNDGLYWNLAQSHADKSGITHIYVGVQGLDPLEKYLQKEQTDDGDDKGYCDDDDSVDVLDFHKFSPV